MLLKENLLESLLASVQQNTNIRMVVLKAEQIVAEQQDGTAYALDVAFAAQHVEKLQHDDVWQQQFVTQLTAHMPQNLMLFPPSEQHFSYLLLFDDGNRIAIELLSKEDMEQLLQLDEQEMQVLLDKDQLAANVQLDAVEPPSIEVFNECCSSFWWGATYVVKSLAKQEFLPAAEHFQQLVRKSLLQMITWQAASEHQFTIHIGKHYRQLPQYLSRARYEQLLATYNIATEQRLLDVLTDIQVLFREATMAVGAYCQFAYPPYDVQVSQLLATMKK
ncbi:aminoglycoside 6-adenylyltransferase [Caryophanon latum]|uniref:Aminoglycoside 6-adenylyltransferase n=1 Tax=Caryophanon latum TaxID=33977 RepID=A0A1C0Z2H9_9BACL|nr:aminoglycoside 6-adenylyltransferase [Caryophanon latum]OCS93550.1 hypothetical protein A6K76_05275 [Caryophanon latum]